MLLLPVGQDQLPRTPVRELRSLAEGAPPRQTAHAATGLAAKNPANRPQLVHPAHAPPAKNPADSYRRTAHASAEERGQKPGQRLPQPALCFRQTTGAPWLGVCGAAPSAGSAAAADRAGGEGPSVT